MLYLRYGNVEIKNRHKYLLQYHIIFVCKYRKKLLMSKQISDDIKQFSYEICQKHKVIIRYMETDKDHIYYMIETEPTMSISKIVNLMKSYTTYHIWKNIRIIYENIFGKNILFGRRIFCPQCRKCFRRDVEKIYRKSRVGRWRQ